MLNGIRHFVEFWTTHSWYELLRIGPRLATHPLQFLTRVTQIQARTFDEPRAVTETLTAPIFACHNGRSGCPLVPSINEPPPLPITR